MSASVAERGIVKFFDEIRGFGFITPESASLDELFVHGSALRAAGISKVERGALLEYERVRGPKGFRAERVRRP